MSRSVHPEPSRGCFRVCVRACVLGFASASGNVLQSVSASLCGIAKGEQLRVDQSDI